MARVVGLKAFQNTLEPIAKRSFHLGLGRQVNSRRDFFYKVEKSNKQTETYLEIGDMDTVPEYTGDLQYADWKEGYKNTITAKEYLLGLKIEYRWMRFDQLRVAKQASEMLGLSMKRRIASDAVYWFNNMFNGAYTTRDGLALSHTAHTSDVGGSSQGNKLTTAFNGVSLSAARIYMRKFVSNLDNTLDIMPRMLAGGIDLEDPFEEVVKSKQRPYTDNNDFNVHYGKFQTVTDVRMYDTNNWGLIDPELMKQFQVWNEVDPIAFEKASDFEARTPKYLVSSLYGYGSIGWEWLLGFEVA